MQYPAANWSWPLVDRGNTAIRHKFTKAEDDLLKQLVAKYGETNWMAVATQMKTRTPRQCRERYKNYLSEKIKNGPWTPQEELLLQEKVKELGQKWAKIALFFESRSDVNVKNHWTALVNRQMREQHSAMMKAKASEVEQKDKNINEFVPMSTQMKIPVVNEEKQSPPSQNSDTPSQSFYSNYSMAKELTPTSTEIPQQQNSFNPGPALGGSLPSNPVEQQNDKSWEDPFSLEPSNEWMATTASGFNGESLFDFY